MGKKSEKNKTDGSTDLEKKKKKTKDKCLRNYKIIMIVGAVTFVICFAMSFAYDAIFMSLVNLNVQVREGSKTYVNWKDPPLDIFLEVVFFDLQNPKEVENGEKPILVEKGPFIYREVRTKVDLKYLEDETQIYYKFKKYWYFDEERSCCPETEIITNINVVYLGTAYVLKNTLPPPLLGTAFFVINRLANNHGLTAWETRTVKELMFEGYEDPLINLAEKFEIIGDIFPIPYNRSGWFYPRNGSENYEGHFTMYTGIGDVEDVGKLVNWKNWTEVPYYDPPCNIITNGSAGELFPPEPTADYVDMFLVDLCRSIRMNFKQETEYKGVPGLRFVADETLFDNSPENDCFNNAVPGLPGSGLANINACQYGAPAWVSFPHFLYANARFAEAVEGLQADEEIHKTFFDLDRITGAPIYSQVGIQVNMLLERYDQLDAFNTMPTVLLPAMWFRSVNGLNDDLAGDLIMMYRSEKLLYMFCALTVVGLILMLVGGVLYWQHKKFERKILSVSKTDLIKNTPNPENAS